MFVVPVVDQRGGVHERAVLQVGVDLAKLFLLRKVVNILDVNRNALTRVVVPIFFLSSFSIFLLFGLVLIRFLVLLFCQIVAVFTKIFSMQKI